jgi:small-conductance mechanosensitive channel
MVFRLTPWPLLDAAIWTAVVIGASYGFGFLINFVVFRRLSRIANKTRGDWDDIVIEELRRRIPFWSLMLGARVALDYWPLPPTWRSIAIVAIKALAFGSMTLAAAGIAGRLTAIHGPRATPTAPVSGLVKNLVRGIVLAVGLLVILTGLGVNVGPMLAALGVGGIAVALALQDPLANLFAGIFVALMRQIRIGDYVRLEPATEGYVTDFNWHSTRIQTMAGNIVIVPNAKVSQAIVTNFSLPSREFNFGVDVIVDPASDMAKVERLANEVAREVQGTVTGAAPGFEPAARYNGFVELGVRMSIGLRAKEPSDQHLMRHEFIKRLDQRFQQEGIAVARAMWSRQT